MTFFKSSFFNYRIYACIGCTFVLLRIEAKSMGTGYIRNSENHLSKISANIT